MVGGIDGGPNLGDAARDTGRGLVVNDADGFEPVTGIGCKGFADLLWSCASAPVAGDDCGFESPLLSHRLPQCREVAGLVAEDLVAGVESVDQSSFPRAGAGGRIDDDLIGGSEDL